MPKFVYIAGPYGADGPYNQIEQNILNARKAATALAYYGVPFFCPHLHTAHFEKQGISESFFQKLNEYFLECCHAILMLPGWENSKGATWEREIAIERGQEVFYSEFEVFNWQTGLKLSGEWDDV